MKKSSYVNDNDVAEGLTVSLDDRCAVLLLFTTLLTVK